jgi:hypothetical protein
VIRRLVQRSSILLRLADYSQQVGTPTTGACGKGFTNLWTAGSRRASFITACAATVRVVRIMGAFWEIGSDWQAEAAGRDLFLFTSGSGSTWDIHIRKSTRPSSAGAVPSNTRRGQTRCSRMIWDSVAPCNTNSGGSRFLRRGGQAIFTTSIQLTFCPKWPTRKSEP